MSTKRPPSKKTALESVRPFPASTFTLNDMPNVEFHFKVPDINDESWTKQTFGKTLGQIFKEGEMISTDDLAKIWFHHLPLKFQRLFPMSSRTVLDPETGEEKAETIPPWRALQIAVKSGVESILVMTAFRNSLIASRPLSDLPEEIKKKLEQVGRDQMGKTTETATTMSIGN